MLVDEVDFSSTTVEDGDEATEAGDEAGSSLSSARVSLLLSKLRLRGLFLDGVAPCFFFGSSHILDSFQ